MGIVQTSLSSLPLLSDMSLRPWPGILLRYSATSVRPLTLASQRPASACVELSRIGSSAKSPAPVSRLAGLSRQFSSSSLKMAPVTKQYDYIVIGGGSGGSGAARRASGWYGAKTCIIDAGVSGGCCVNVWVRPQENDLELCLHRRSHEGRKALRIHICRRQFLRLHEFCREKRCENKSFERRL